MSGESGDTIVGPATPPGRSALAIVRIDGPHSGAIVAALAGGTLPIVRMATLVDIQRKGEKLDEAIAVRYVAPHSFTGNDMAELTIHGNPLLVEEVISAAIELGARMAEPGEFTERAVLNGKMDLLQAESIFGLINSRTALQARLSLSNLKGALSRKAQKVRETLLFVISRLEAALDFSEEGYEFINRSEARRRLEEAIRETRWLADSYRRGRATAAGLSAVILGRPNAGKSTLMNRLVGSDRAIVTPIPGTTRDILRETIEIGGLPVTLADTAGLRESEDIVEEIGISRAREAGRQADLLLYLIDSSVGMTDDDLRELGRLSVRGSGSGGRRGVKGEEGPSIILIYTKTDLAAAPAAALGVSVAKESGISTLFQRLDSEVRERFVAAEASLINERQRQAVLECQGAMIAAVASIDAGHEEQLVLVDLYRASSALALLTGAITKDEIIHEIFAKFCIGK